MNWAEFKSRAILVAYSLPTGGWKGIYFVIFEPTVLHLLSSSFTPNLCAISNTEQREAAGETTDTWRWEPMLY